MVVYVDPLGEELRAGLHQVRALSSDFVALTFPDGSGIVQVADRGTLKDGCRVPGLQPL